MSQIISKQMIQVDLSEFTKGAKRLFKQDWPKAVVTSFSQIANAANEAVIKKTETEFELHTDYITKGIKHYPATTAQQQRAMHALEKYGDMNAAVYLRGAQDPKRSLAFMVEHEEGGMREPAYGVALGTSVGEKYIATPTKDLNAKGVRTSRGQMRKKYRPSSLLKRYTEAGSTFSGNTTKTAKRVRVKGGRKNRFGSAFIMKVRDKPFIVRRRSTTYNDLEFLYVLIPQATFRKRWGFEKTVWQNVSITYGPTIIKHVAAMPNYGRVK